ncbi:MAG: hypothetical protein A2474_04250 [Elusimicrobia bacterium RIFOXYC2_FULL_34_12]|nr:MAG: hypothetical protein A2474_04250 [Elusimicrobia bacterium RIFOXYC2_FULL_34_12]HAM38474.1 NAD(P)/FAD-dependent oxidoreductase [Elusimicrobiota bacterium]
MNYIIIGASAAGISAIESIRTVDKNGKITIISDENYSIYSRCVLSYYLAGIVSEDKLKYREDDFYKKYNVNAILGKKVVSVLPDKKIKLSDGSEIPFDKLLIATGSRSKMENITGIEKEGVFGLRNIDDAKRIDLRLIKTKSAVMLGGGLIGLRAAYALHKRAVNVTVVVKSKHVLSQMMDEEGASFVQKRMQEQGINILTGLAAKEIIGDKEVKSVILENGNKIDCEIVVIGKGVQPNIELVKNTNIKTDWGIVVNEFLQTTVPDIYSAGDVAQSSDLITGESTINALWPNAIAQGKVAGLNMAGKNVKYSGSIGMNSVEFFDLPTISYGITKPKGEGFEILIKKNSVKNIYKKIILKNNKLVGFVLVSDVNQSGVYGSLIEKKIDVSSIKNNLLDNNFNFAKILPLISENRKNFTEPEYDEILITNK